MATARAEAAIASIFAALDKEVKSIQDPHRERDREADPGDELSPGVIKMVKVYVAVKRKLMVGDKMAGRHGNKGVVSRILPREDMPYRSDGRRSHLVLNPLGVPSRMNVGQILETHLGLAALSSGEVLDEMIETVASADELRTVLNNYYDSDAASEDRRTRRRRRAGRRQQRAARSARGDAGLRRRQRG